MNMRQIVAKLQIQGHRVSYYVRKDGGILIKSIDGEKFTTGASGNMRARQILGVQASEARIRQLEYATRQRGRKKFDLDEEIEKEYQRVKKIWKRKIKPKKHQPHPAGYFGRGRIEYAVKMHGKEEALRRIREAERYALGIAYSKNVEYLIMMVRDSGLKLNSQELLQLADDIQENIYNIKEEWIKPAYDELYKLNTGVSPKDVAKNTRRILRL